MKRNIIWITFIGIQLIYFENIQAQEKTKSTKNKRSQLEVTSFYSYDKYPEFRYHINPTYDHVINIKGHSWGIDLGYKIINSKKIRVKPFIGYYRFSFNNIDNYNEFFELYVKSRETTLTPAPGVLFPISTNKYFYDCLNLGVSMEKVFITKKSITISGGISLNNYLTFSQRYFTSYDNPNYPIDNPHKRKRVSVFGFRPEGFAKFLIPINKIELGPLIKVPIYTVWKTDAFFNNENNSDTRDKWVNGWCIGISVNYIIK